MLDIIPVKEMHIGTTASHRSTPARMAMIEEAVGGERTSRHTSLAARGTAVEEFGRFSKNGP